MQRDDETQIREGCFNAARSKIYQNSTDFKIKRGFLLHILTSPELVSVKVHARLVFHGCVLMYFLYFLKF